MRTIVLAGAALRSGCGEKSAPKSCEYVVRWLGTRNGGSNVIPG